MRRDQLMGDGMPDICELDLRGLVCPMPIIRLTSFIESLTEGACCHILADDAGFIQDLPAWSVQTGNPVVSICVAGDGVIHARIQKNVVSFDV